MSEEATLDEFAASTEDDPQEQEKSRFWDEIPEGWNLVDGSEVYDVNPNPKPIDEPNTYIEMDALDTVLPWPKYFGTRNTSEYSGKTFTSGDTLFARITPCTENGKAALVPDMETEVGIGSTEYAVLSPKREIINPWFLYYLSNSHPVHNYAVSRMRGSTGRQRVPFSVFRRELDVALPPLPEQCKISAVLYNVDKAIEKTKQIVDQLVHVKQGIAQDIFKNGAFQHNDHQKSIVGEFPVSWKLEKLGDLVDLRNGLNFSSDQKGKGTLLANVPNVYGTIDIIPSELSRVDISDSEVEKYKLEKGDIITVRSSVDAEGVGQVAIYRGSDEPVVFAGFTIRQRPKHNSINPEYLVQYLRYPETRKRVVALGGEVALTNISQGDLAKIEVPVPSEDEQKEIVNILRMFDQQIALEKDQIKRLNCLKKALIKDLISGTVRTTDTTIQVPDEVAQHG